MSKTKIIILICTVLLLLIGGSYAYWEWNSDNKNLIFNTSEDLEEYVVYDEGESTFVGGVTASDDYTSGIHSTISIKKTSDVEDVTLLATINMDIKSIGSSMINSSALKWVVTNSDNEILNSGNFIGVTENDTLKLLSLVEITQIEEKYTIWIWLDKSENPSSNLTMETLDTVVWTEINQR